MTRMTIEEWRRETGQISKKSKYGNTKTKEGDSKKEVNRKMDLLLLEKRGEITNLRFQVTFQLIPRQKKSDGKFERPVSYVADFTYFENGRLVVEDVKSNFTRKLPLYVVKRKMLLYFHGLEIRET